MTTPQNLQHPREAQDRLILERLKQEDMSDYNLAELGRLLIRYDGFPGAETNKNSWPNSWKNGTLRRRNSLSAPVLSMPEAVFTRWAAVSGKTGLKLLCHRDDLRYESLFLLLARGCDCLGQLLEPDVGIPVRLEAGDRE